ncbi:MAG: hypothetical protein MJ169_04250 [Treponema sp.]|nr:hypothetical protein [Treponema sp.]
MKKPELSKENFCREFNERFGQEVSDIELINIEGAPQVFKALNLEPQYGGNQLWGLLVFCKEKIYFFVHSSESFMGSMFRVAAQKDAPPEQMIELTALNGLKVVDHKRRWYDFLFGYTRFQIDGRFCSDGQELRFVINTQNPAGDVREKLKGYGL